MKNPEYIQAMATLLTAIVAAVGILISYMTIRLTKQQNEANRQEARSKRFTSAIEHLKDESLAIRMGALFELKKLGLESKEEQESIVRILSPFIRNAIENETLLQPPVKENGLPRPQDDVFIACEIASLFYEQSEQRANLDHLKAEKLDLQGIKLQGAILHEANLLGANLFGANMQGVNLQSANLQGANLNEANLQGANLSCTNLQGAGLSGVDLRGVNLQLANLQGANLFKGNLQGANLSYINLQGASLHSVNLQGVDLFFANLQKANLLWVKKLTAKQLLDPYITYDDSTELDDHLANDPRIKARIAKCIAEREANGEKETK